MSPAIKVLTKRYTWAKAEIHTDDKWIGDWEWRSYPPPSQADQTFTEYSSYLKKEKKKLISQSAQMNSDISNLNMNKLFFLNWTTVDLQYY